MERSTSSFDRRLTFSSSTSKMHSFVVLFLKEERGDPWHYLVPNSCISEQQKMALFRLNGMGRPSSLSEEDLALYKRELKVVSPSLIWPSISHLRVNQNPFLEDKPVDAIYEIYLCREFL